MDPSRAVPLGFRKDALIAQFAADAARWHVVEGAAYAAAGVGVIAWLGRSIGAWDVVFVTLLAAILGAMATRRLDRQKAVFNRELERLLGETERLMGSDVA